MATDTLISAERSPDCPGDNEFRLLVREGDPHATEWLEMHLEICAFCRRRLNLLAGIEHLVPKGGWAGTGIQKTADLQAVMDRAGRREFVDEAASGSAAQELNREILSPPVQPESLGRFAGCDVLERIANGGMGVVFKALDPALNRMVAIKVLAPALAANEIARFRFLREARAAAAVTHEHVVAIHAVGEERGLPFLVMPFVAGPSLDACLQNGPLDLERILRIGRQTALGLAAAHAQGLIHRDIKPGNILLENGVERVKLTDFGLARAVDSPAITRDGVIAGTPEFMSPEQARGERIDARSDLFSLGCVLYMMATGRPPFRADSTPATLKRVCELDPPLAHQVNPAIPVWLSELIALLMAKEPDRRVADAKQLARLLEEGLSRLQLGINDDPEKPALVSEYSRRQRRWRWYASGMLATGALFIGLIQWMRRGPAGESGALASPAKPGHFRVVKEGATPREFATLKDAVLQAENGSSIEVHFDGPKTFDPLDISQPDLRIRAAPGMRPILVNREPGVSFLRTTGSLTLEGLEIRAWNADCDSTALGNPDSDTKQLITEKLRDRLSVGDGIPALIRVRGGNLTARNCRFVTSLRDYRSTDGIEVVGSRKVELTGCEFYTLEAYQSGGGRWAIASRAQQMPHSLSPFPIVSSCQSAPLPWRAKVGNAM